MTPTQRRALVRVAASAAALGALIGWLLARGAYIVDRNFISRTDVSAGTAVATQGPGRAHFFSADWSYSTMTGPLAAGFAAALSITFIAVAVALFVSILRRNNKPHLTNLTPLQLIENHYPAPLITRNRTSE